MKTFIPKGDKFIITSASFIAPQSIDGFTANKRYQLYNVSYGDIRYGFSHSTSKDLPIYGLALNDDGVEFLVGNIGLRSHVGRRLFSELVVFNIESSYDNHRAQKKALRHRHMLIRAFVKLGHSYGWCDSKIKRTCFNINRKRGNKYETHTLKEWARQMAAPYFNDDGSLAKIDYMIDEQDHEIDQEFFDAMAEEDLNCL